jgi:hypothetical protein
MMPNQYLTVADGAVFRADIYEMPDGAWRASGIVRLDEKFGMQEQIVLIRQTSEIEMFPTEQAARARIDRAGAARGFKSYKLKVHYQ